MRLVLVYVVTLVAFVGIDMVWLGYVAKSTYAAEMGNLIRPQIDFRAAVAFYLLYAAGLMYFAVMPALESRSVVQGLTQGLAIGLMAYGTYDLTNLAIMNGYSVKIALIDLVWGTVLSGISGAVVVGLFVR